MSIINNIRMINHPLFGDTSVDLSSKSKGNSNYFSLIIGDNGTGKSELLKSIIEGLKFNETYRDQLPGLFEGSGIAEYHFNDGNFDFPSKTIASSFILNDKFPQSIAGSGFLSRTYKYLGIRSASNNAFIGKYKTDFIDAFGFIIESKSKKNSFVALLDYLDLKKDFSFKVLTRPQAHKIFQLAANSNSHKTFINILEREAASLRDSKRMSDQRLYRIFFTDEDKTYSLKLYKAARSYYLNRNKFNLEIDFMDEISCKRFLNISPVIKTLLDANLLSIGDFYISKDYSFANASSGQFHIFSSMVKITAELCDNAIILIDEPEVSLHPKLQLNYISALKKILDGFNGCHVIIATHSHFLVSSLPIDNASVITSNKSGEKINFEILSASTSGWSAESILYNVFGVMTARSNSFESDLNIIASLMSNWDASEKSTSVYKNALSRINRFKLPDNDPLNVFSEKAAAFLEERLNAGI
ncbi:AAA family ATPase [Yersinia enterocolitica]|uniref:AAA family ATPase n=1 Tax=Yersinia enterocolitica TaxID=630 RepID=UPI003F4689D6